MTIHRSLRFVLLLALAAALVSCKKKQGMVIGLYASMTGGKAHFGISTRQGVDLAVSDLNAHGGLLGQRIRLEVLDDRGDASEAASAVTRLIDQEHAVGILGEISSGLSIQGGRICQRKRIPMVSPSSTNPDVTRVGDYIFRVCFLDTFQGEVMARFARNTLHYDRVAILTDQASPYSVGLADAFRTSFTRLGGTVVGAESYRENDTHFSAQIRTLLDLRPQGIFVPGYYTEVALIAHEARGAGFQGHFLGGDGWSSRSLTENDNNHLVGDYFSDGFSPEGASNPVAQDFVRRFRETYHTEPTGLAALGYDAALVMFDAIRRAGSTDPARIRDALARTRNVLGATGSITLNEHRDAVKSAVILEVRENSFRYHETVNP